MFRPFLFRYNALMSLISWDSGTAYDLFSSLYILNHPVMFGVRPAWAAGVRSRLPSAQRAFLEETFSFLDVPLAWMYQIQSRPKDAAAILAALEAIPPGDRLAAISYSAHLSRETAPILKAMQIRCSCLPAEQEALRAIYQRKRITIWPGMFQRMCEAWCHPADFGEHLLEALRIYCQVFFFEEEQRIAPVIEASLQSSRRLAEQVPIGELIETLSRGVQVDLIDNGVVLVPSFWAGPLIFINKVSLDRYILLYGGRPENQALMPGEDVPPTLLAALNALSDPTRLRILRYLATRSLRLAELSRLLRLRPPTVLHHLYVLRTAELIQITFLEDSERRYSLRQEALGNVMDALNHFLQDVSF
jgi:DNA-binding transcriptional ArsR family regulator